MSEPVNRKRPFRSVQDQRQRHIDVLEAGLVAIGNEPMIARAVATRLVDLGIRVRWSGEAS